MPCICAVIGCSNRGQRTEKGVKFFRVPKVSQIPSQVPLTTKRREIWIKNLRRDIPIDTTADIRICSKHFITGILNEITI